MLYLLFAFLALSLSLSIEEARSEFEGFKVRFKRSYPTKEAEEYRLGVFRANLEAAHAKNALRVSDEDATFGVTKFSDMTPDEFRSQYLMPTPMKSHYRPGDRVWNASSVSTPAYYNVNWFSKGACTSVYDQAQCGSCWAFSVTEAIESSTYLSGQSLVSLSMQQIVSCDTSDDGCNGGDPPTAYQYVISAGGLEGYNAYPYSSGNGYTGQCEFDSSQIVRSISNWQWVTQSQDENAMLQFVSSTGPPSICVDASSWSSYTGGVVTASQCGTQLDHCVQLVGYDQSDYSYPAWIVRNSWGTDWGESGFIYLQYGQNTCGVAQEVTWPTV